MSRAKRREEEEEFSSRKIRYPGGSDLLRILRRKLAHGLSVRAFVNSGDEAEQTKEQRFLLKVLS